MSELRDVDKALQESEELSAKLLKRRNEIAPWPVFYGSLETFEDHAKAWEVGQKYGTSLDITMGWKVKEWKKWRASLVE